ncbi:MAG: hypothetical protein M5U22_21595 [Thermoleophilia bacterium]|nr:hypothetical protein [Thermoleophilia bacterium]
MADLARSAHLYENTGFPVVARVSDDRYRQPLQSLRLELPLGSAKG